MHMFWSLKINQRDGSLIDGCLIKKYLTYMDRGVIIGLPTLLMMSIGGDSYELH